MKLPEGIQGIEVYYDGRCGMCCSFHEWINRRPRAFGIAFIPYLAADAERVFPGIGMLDPAREMMVRTGEKEIFRGAEAWVLCLLSCARSPQALDCGSLLPISVKQPAATGQTWERFCYAKRLAALKAALPANAARSRQAERPKATSGCSSPRPTT